MKEEVKEKEKEEKKEQNEKEEPKEKKEVKKIKKKGKSLSNNKTLSQIRDFHYLVPLMRFKDLGKENNKRQGYMATEKQRQEFLKKLYICTNPIANYFSPKYHGRSWWPNGQYIVKRRYNHTQSGLEHYYEKNNVEQLKPIDTEKKVKKDSEYLKDFMEFDSITPGNYAITIEYCSSCEDHSGITLHGIEDIFRELAIKYEKIIKERFPFIKVYLKPADVDIVKNETFKMRLPAKNGDPYPSFPFINDQFKKCRIGAFEIQIATKDRLGNKKISLIHSKLKTKRFPNVNNVLDKIVSLMPMFNLNLVLFDQEDYQDLDKMNGIEVNIYLCNSKIIRGLSNGAKEQINNFISPGRRFEMIQRQKIMQEQNFNKAERDNNFNTFFANPSRRLYSTRSNFRALNTSSGSYSNKKMKKNNSDGHDIFSSTNSCLSSDINGLNVNEYKNLKDQRGQLIKKYFTKIDPNLTKEEYYNSSESVSVKVDVMPYDTYIIETKENCYFQSSITLLRFNEINTKDNGIVTKYIGLWHQQKAILNIHLYKEIQVEVPQSLENKNDENQPKTREEQIPIRTGIITISDADDPNSRYQVYSNKKGIYEYKTQPGEYKLEIDTKDFERDVRKIKLKAGLNTLNIKLNPDKNCELLIEVLEYNEVIIEDKENENVNIDLIPVRNAKVQIYKSSINLLMEGITNKKGLMKYLVDKNDNNLSIKITKDGYFRAERFFKKYSTMKINDKGNYISTMRFILVNQQRLSYFQKIIFISYANVCKKIFELKFDCENNKNNIQIKDWQKEKGIFIATFLQEEAEDENKSNMDENNSRIIIKRGNNKNILNDNDEKCTYEEIIRFGLQISPNVIKDEENYNDDCKVTYRDLIEYLRNICCEGNVYTPKSDFHINLPKVYNKLEPKNQADSNILYINKNSLDKSNNNNNNNDNDENSLKDTKRVVNDLYWDLGWLDPKNFIYYETSVFFDNVHKPGRLTYYEFFIEFLQALIDKQVYNSLFNYFHFNLSILTRGDRYLPKKIFVKKMFELIIVNEESDDNREELINTINFICNILCGYDEENNIRDDSISFNLLKKKVSSNIINFIQQ